MAAEQRLVQLVVFAGRAGVHVDHATREEPENVSFLVRVGVRGW